MGFKSPVKLYATATARCLHLPVPASSQSCRCCPGPLGAAPNGPLLPPLVARLLANHSAHFDAAFGGRIVCRGRRSQAARRCWSIADHPVGMGSHRRRLGAPGPMATARLPFQAVASCCGSGTFGDGGGRRPGGSNGAGAAIEQRESLRSVDFSARILCSTATNIDRSASSDHGRKCLKHNFSP